MMPRPAAVARRAVIGTVVHAGQLTGEQRDFDDLLDTLLAYRGVSAAGIEGVRAAGFAASVSAGLSEAARVTATPLHGLD